MTETTPAEPPTTTHPGHAIAISGVVKHYGRKAAVAGLDLTLPVGVVCGLVGPNGAGKTTTIAMLLGLIPPSSGRLSVLGLDPTRDSLALRQRIGYVPEQHYMYEWMKVRQVLSFARHLYPTWNDAECNRLAAAFDLPLRQRVKTLSRGQTAKVALTIALAHQPRLLVLDEPTSGLDPVVRREVLLMVHDLIRQRACTVLFSTHILSDVERIADRVVVMNSGRVIADEPLEDLRRRYVRASFLFPVPPAEHVQVPEALRIDKSQREWLVVFGGGLSEQRIREIASRCGASDCLLQPLKLDDVFAELVSAPRAPQPAGGAA